MALNRMVFHKKNDFFGTILMFFRLCIFGPKFDFKEIQILNWAKSTNSLDNVINKQKKLQRDNLLFGQFKSGATLFLIRNHDYHWGKALPRS